jgi:hypothetical protein
MAKRQTRKSISVKGLTYQRLKKWADANGKSCSGALEEFIAEKMGALGVPEETVLDLPVSKPQTLGNFSGSTFTF